MVVGDSNPRNYGYANGTFKFLIGKKTALGGLLKPLNSRFKQAVKINWKDENLFLRAE